jgi:hypothetical protein
MNKAFDQTWRAVSEELLEEMNQWQAAHPKATFQELEHALHERMSRLETQVLQEAVQARSASDWRQAPERDHPRCPSCGTPLLARGKHARHLQGAGGQEVTLLRSYGSCPTCGVGLFPPR